MNELKKILKKNNYTCSEWQRRQERASACLGLGPDLLNRDLQRRVLSFIAVNDVKKKNLFIKQEKDYIVQIELNDIDEIYVNFVLKRIFKNMQSCDKVIFRNGKDKEFELINEKRKKLKFIKNIQKIIDNEVNLSPKADDLLHIGIYCSNDCEETIKKNVDNYQFNNIYGYYDKFYIQGGVWITTFDEESRQIIRKNLMSMKSCPDCSIISEEILIN